MVAPDDGGRTDFATDVRVGLTAAPKWLPCLYFYDEVGSHLFEQICQLPDSWDEIESFAREVLGG